MKRFENKTILVTGASSGIGLAGAKRLIEEGAHVIFTGRTESHVQAAAAELGDHATAVLDDVSDGNTLERIMPVVVCGSMPHTQPEVLWKRWIRRLSIRYLR